MKEKLANTMAFGDTQEQTVQVVTTVPKKQAPKLPSTKEVWHDCKDIAIHITNILSLIPFEYLKLTVAEKAVQMAAISACTTYCTSVFVISLIFIL